MIENLPLYIVVLFIATTVTTLGIFHYAIKRGAYSSTPTKVLSFLLPFWLFFQATITILGFYQVTDTIPPRIMALGILPALLTIAALFTFSRSFILRLPLFALTIIHIVRISVEIVLHQLYQNDQIPQLMTYEGRNFDILTGITATIIAWAAFRGGAINRPLLIIWNFLGLGLLFNIVINALLAFPSPLQKIAFDHPNKAIMFFPFSWLPTFIVPVILFCHLASLYQLFVKKD